MGTIRVLLAVDQQMNRQLLRDAVASEADMEVVGEVAEPVDLLVRVAETGANVVLCSWAESAEVPPICTHLLAEYPGLLVVGLSESGISAWACQQTITLTRLPRPGISELLSEIRQRAGDVPVEELVEQSCR